MEWCRECNQPYPHPRDYDRTREGEQELRDARARHDRQHDSFHADAVGPCVTDIAGNLHPAAAPR